MPGRPRHSRSIISQRLRTGLAALTAITITSGAGLQPAAASAARASSAISAATDRLAAARPGGAQLTQAKALQRARASGKRVAVTSATTPDSTLTANPDGTFTLTQESVPVRKHVADRWLRLDPTLRRGRNGSVSPAVTTSALRLSGGGTGPLAVMTDAGASLALTPPFRLPAPVLSGATATYPAVLPGVDLQVTADDQGGFSEVLVVKNAAAAADPRLQALTFGTQVRGGIRLRADAAGNTAAVTPGGHVIFSAPAPRLWDSTAPTAAVPSVTNPATGQRVDRVTGAPVASSARGPGSGARTGRVAVHPGPGTLTLAPDLSVLSGATTRYPVYIDPTYAAGSIEQAWTQVDSGFQTTSYWKESSDLQVGLCPVSLEPSGSCNGMGVARSFVQESVPPTLYTATIYSSTVFFTDEVAPACDNGQGNFEVQLWQTSGISSSTTWSSMVNNNQPAWIADEYNKAFAHGYSSSCLPASEGFPITSLMQSAASGHWPNVTLGLRATDENDPYGWKQFSYVVTMTTTYDHRPNTPTALTTSPATSCSASPPGTAGDGDVILYAGVFDPDGGSLSASFTSYNTTTNATLDNATVPATSGTIAALRIPQSKLEPAAGGSITEFSWHVTVSDGTLSSATSVTCNFSFDPTHPGEPIVNGCPAATQPQGTIGTPISFSVTPVSGTTPAAYSVQLNGAAPTSVTASSGNATVTVTPTRFTDVLTVVPLSPGGNVGVAASCVFNAAAPSPAADGDLTGDGIPDLITPGGNGTGLPAGLWLARQQAAASLGTGDGQVMPTATDIGAEGDGISGTPTPSEFTDAEAITGAFTDDGLQDVLVYYPPGTSYAGQAVIMAGAGDGSVLQTEDTSNTFQIPSDTFTNSDPNSDIPLQVANGYNADPDGNPNGTDLITVSGDQINGYYLEYYQNGGEPSSYIGSIQLLSTTAPDGTMDWNNWKIATMAGAAGSADMFLYDASTGALWLWQNLTIDDATGTASYTGYQLSTSWNPGTLTELRAANILGAGPAVWAVTTSGTVTAWTLSGPPDSPTITKGALQSLSTPTHAWWLGDGTNGSVTTAADAETPSLPLSGIGTSAPTWDTASPLYSSDVLFNGTSDNLTSQVQTAAFNPSSSFTISAWVDPSVLGGTVFSQNGTDDASVEVSATTSGQWSVGMNTGGTTSDSYTTATGSTALTNVWTNLTLTYDTTEGADILKLYTNGVEIAYLRDASPPSIQGQFVLGSWQVNGAPTNYFNGQMADVEVWNTVAPPLQPATPGSVFVPITPVRIMDTRSGSKIGPVTGPVVANSTTTVTIDGNTIASLPASGITAVAVSATVTSQTASGFLTIYPSATPRPATSAVNFPATGTVTNNTIVPVGPDGDIAIYNATATLQLIVDVTGYFTTDTTPAGASTFTPLSSPTRILDTRNGTGAPKASIPNNQALTLTIAGDNVGGVNIPSTGVTAVALNLTVVATVAGDHGFLTTYADGQARPSPLTSNVSYGAFSSDQAGTVILPIPVGADGKIDIYVDSAGGDAVNLVGDLSGYFTTSTTGQQYHPLDSTRILDTRQTSALGANATRIIAVPANIMVNNPTLILNLTATAEADSGVLVAYPASITPAPATSTLDYAANQDIANLALVNTADQDSFAIYNNSSGSAQVIVDTNGYFS